MSYLVKPELRSIFYEKHLNDIIYLRFFIASKYRKSICIVVAQKTSIANLKFINISREIKYTFPESVRQQTRRRGSIAKVLIYAKLHVKSKMILWILIDDTLNAFRKGVLPTHANYHCSHEEQCCNRLFQ